MTVGELSRIDRIRAGVAVVVLHGLLAYALVAGLWTRASTPRSEALTLIEVALEPPPPPAKPVSPPRRSERPEGEGSPPNIRSVATEVVAPRPQIQLPLPPPLIAASQPDVGSDPSSGMADIPGPGTGRGGEGDGDGMGRGGYGAGGGPRGTPPRRIKGRLKDLDYPRDAWEPGVGGTVSVIFAVQADGRVTDCMITRSSGSAALDETTCRLIERRYRFEPAQDDDGRPVRSRVTENHSWIIEQLPPEER